MILGILSVAGLVAGVLSFGAFGYTQARNSEVIVGPDVNFGFLQDPRMVAVSESHFYVFSGHIGVFRLCIIDRTTRQTIVSSAHFDALPLDIRVANNHLFLFFATNYRVLPLSSVTNPSVPNFDISPSSILLSPPQNMLTGQIHTAFSVRALTISTVRVHFASTRFFGWHDLTLGSWAQDDHGLGNLPNQPNTIIRGIAEHPNGTIYTITSFIHHNHFRIFEDGIVLGELFTAMPSSFHIVGDFLVFLLGQQIISFNLDTHKLTFIDPATTNDFLVAQSYEPVHISALSPSEVFVLDARKSSIDQYHHNVNNVLAFSAPVFAAQGDGFGFLNVPTAMGLIGERELVVADFSPNFRNLRGQNQYRQVPWGQPRGEEIFMISAITSNLHNIVFAAATFFPEGQSTNAQTRILTFDTRGNRLEESWTHFYIGENPHPFEGITQIFTNPATGQVFALDVNTMALSPTGRILALEHGRFVAVQTPFIITGDTRAVISNTLSAPRLPDLLVLVNAQVGTAHVNVALELPARNISNPGNILLPRPLEFNEPSIIRDVAVDTLGNLVILAEDELTREVSLNHFVFTQGTGTNFTLTPHPQGWQVLSEATLSRNPSLQFDRLSNRLYWLGTRHAVEGTSMLTQQDGLVWSFRHPSPIHHYDWEQRNHEVRTPILTPAATRPLFGQINDLADEFTPLMFDFPASINPRREMPKGAVFIILKNLETVHPTDTIYRGRAFPYSLVSFQVPIPGQAIGQQHVGYINNRFIDFTFSEYATNDDVFQTGGENLSNRGRVILNGVPIFKYPTAMIYALRIGVLQKTTPTGENSITVSRRITQVDARGWEFFEIRINRDGTPNPLGDYVGFVFERHVIDFYSNPSIHVAQFRPNARVSVPSTVNPRVAHIFEDAHGLIPRGEGDNREFLNQGTRIFIRNRLDRDRPFTEVYYHDAELDLIMRGFIRTDFITPSTLSVLQIIGLAVAGLGIITAIALFVMHVKRRRATN